MGFITVVPPDKANCVCKKPESKKGTYFGPNTVWVCDTCGKAWLFLKYQSGQMDSYDDWKRAPEHDGPDNRPTPTVGNNVGAWHAGHKPGCRCTNG